MVLSNYYELCVQLADMGYPDPYLKHQMRDLIQLDLPEFQLSPVMGNIPWNSDMVDYDLRFKKYGSYYVWESAEVSLLRNLPIRHMEVAGMDTALLEQRMKPINWWLDYNNPSALVNTSMGPGQLISRYEEGKRHDSHGFNRGLTDWEKTNIDNLIAGVTGIVKDLIQLQKHGSERAMEIASQLHQRYLMQGSRHLDPLLNMRLSSLKPFLSHEFDMIMNPFSFRKAYNLLCGRPVRQKINVYGTGVSDRWHRLGIDLLGNGDAREMIVSEDFNLGSQLDVLRIPTMTAHGRHVALKILYDGDLLFLSSQAGPVAVTVDAAKGKLIGVDEYMQMIDLERLTARLGNHNKLPDGSQRIDPHRQLVSKIASRLKKANPFNKKHLRRPG